MSNFPPDVSDDDFDRYSLDDHPVLIREREMSKVNENAINAAGWKLMECAGPAIPFNRLKNVAREVVIAYLASCQRIESAKADK